MAKNTMMVLLVGCAVAVVVLGLGLNYRTKQARETATELRDARDRFCTNVHSDLLSFRDALPDYERKAQETARPITTLGRLLHERQIGMYQSLRYCLGTDDETHVMLSEFRAASEIDEARELIDELADRLRAQYL